MRIIAVVLVSLAAASSAARDVPVSTIQGLRDAITAAQPGDVIVLANGTYPITSKINCNAIGTESAPIVVRAANAHGARLTSDTVEAFSVNAPYWTFDGLEMEGVCADDGDCEHAFHIVAGGDHTVIRNCKLHDFNAQIKGNGDAAQASRPYPDDVLIEHTELYDTRIRDTDAPVTKVDVVGGRRWLLRDNYIHDFEKGGGNHVSYAAFLKGASRDGIFERNLVVCSRLHGGSGARIGLSFGGGLTGAAFCETTEAENPSCATEHFNGIMRNNIVMHCSDVGIYNSRSNGTQLLDNLVYDTSGVDSRYSTSSVTARNNIVVGGFHPRDGGTIDAANNLLLTNTQVEALYVNVADNDLAPAAADSIIDDGVTLAAVTDDYCGQPRDQGAYDIGPVEYRATGGCDTSVWPKTLPSEPGDDGGPSDDGGPTDSDGGDDRGDGNGDAGAGDSDQRGGDDFPTGASGGCAALPVGSLIITLGAAIAMWPRRSERS